MLKKSNLFQKLQIKLKMEKIMILFQESNFIKSYKITCLCINKRQYSFVLLAWWWCACHADQRNSKEKPWTEVNYRTNNGWYHRWTFLFAMLRDKMIHWWQAHEGRRPTRIGLGRTTEIRKNNGRKLASPGGRKGLCSLFLS